MRRFQFRLERFLQLRRYKEREWQLKLADITGQCIVLANKIKECTQNISYTLGLRQFDSGVLDIYSLFANELYIARMKQQIVYLKRELVSKEKEREQVKNKYLQASRARKVLEKLREKRAEEYYYDQRREEFKVLDDINGGAAIRKMLKQV